MTTTMSATALNKAIDELGMSQVAAAEYFGINERTMRRYALGEYPVPRAIELQLKTLLAMSPRARSQELSRGARR